MFVYVTDTVMPRGYQEKGIVCRLFCIRMVNVYRVVRLCVDNNVVPARVATIATNIQFL